MSLIPATILTGFLGSGKTTLLKRVLQEGHGQKIAVIENEFGEENIDSDILVTESKEQIIQMSNGCICCTIREDLRDTLQLLAAKKRKGLLDFDRVVIETTGLADPGPVAQTFFMDDEVQSKTKIDGIVTLVDAKHVLLHWDSHEVQEQIAFADVILLNKTDLVAPAELDALEKRIARINTQARIYRTKNADIDLNKVLNVKGFDLDRILEHEPEFLKTGGHKHDHKDHHHDEPDNKDHSHCDHEHDHCEHEHEDDLGSGKTHGLDIVEPSDHKHDESVSSVGIALDGDLDAKKLNNWMSELLRVKGTDIFRMKGILSIKNDPNRFVFQGVHMLFDGRPDKPWGKTPRSNKLIFIGRNLNRQELTEGFKRCLAS
jgi:G3E family GTPase